MAGPSSVRAKTQPPLESRSSNHAGEVEGMRAHVEVGSFSVFLWKKKKDELELLPVYEGEQRGRRVGVCRFGPCLAGRTLPSGSH